MSQFHCHYAYRSGVTGRIFLKLLLQIKYATPDDPNNIGLTFSPKTRLLQVGRKRIFSMSLKTDKIHRKLQKSLCCSFFRVYSYNDWTMCSLRSFLARYCLDQNSRISSVSGDRRKDENQNPKSLTLPRFPRISKNRLNTSLDIAPSISKLLYAFIENYAIVKILAGNIESLCYFAISFHNLNDEL